MPETHTFNDAANIVHKHFKEFMTNNKYELSNQQKDKLHWLEFSILTELNSLEKEEGSTADENQMDIYDIIGE